MKKTQGAKVWRIDSTANDNSFSPKIKEQIKSIATDEIKSLSKLSKKISRIEMRSNRLYLYELYEPSADKSSI
jgi:hypothetical protein